MGQTFKYAHNFVFFSWTIAEKFLIWNFGGWKQKKNFFFLPQFVYSRKLSIKSSPSFIWALSKFSINANQSMKMPFSSFYLFSHNKGKRRLASNFSSFFSFQTSSRQFYFLLSFKVFLIHGAVPPTQWNVHHRKFSFLFSFSAISKENFSCLSLQDFPKW